MAHKVREKNLNRAEAILKALLEKHGSIKEWEFLDALTNQMKINEDSAKSYWKHLKNSEKYGYNGMDIWVKGKKPKLC